MSTSAACSATGSPSPGSFLRPGTPSPGAAASAAGFESSRTAQAAGSTGTVL